MVETELLETLDASVEESEKLKNTSTDSSFEEDVEFDESVFEDLESNDL